MPTTKMSTPFEAYATAGQRPGAALLSLLLQMHPGLFSGAALLCGYVIELPAAVDLRGTPVLVVHGRRDPVVPLDAAERGANFLEDRGAVVRLVAAGTLPA